ncbi:MAG: ATP-binding cassette domain-containing protein, partial [Thermoleophilia bacterium]|nr:ATP-binding cassette domain-containing protein [Thermoleophilia bacterium]
MQSQATVVPPRLEVAEARRGVDEDFDTLPSQISVRHLDFFYGKSQALFDNDIEIKKNRVTAVIGPSGCGKSTHIRTYNRIFNLYRDQRATGQILMDGVDLLSPQTDLLDLRRRIGMIFQKPSPFPMTVFDNVAYGLRQHYRLSRSELSDRVEEALKRSAIWDEVKHKLNEPG